MFMLGPAAAAATTILLSEQQLAAEVAQPYMSM